MNNDTSAALLAEIRVLRRELENQSKQQTSINTQLVNELKAGRRSQQQQNNNSDDWAAAFSEIGIAWGIGLAVIALHQGSMLVQGKSTMVDRFLGTDFDRPVEVGQTIAGYEVTSPFGMRSHPITGEYRLHAGVDVSTPEGTTLYFPVDGGKVECLNDSDGYGIYAVITPINAAVGYEFLAGHLSHCGAGTYRFGQIFAKTGNTGMSSGPHLHWEQIKDGKPIKPAKGWLVQLLTGNKVTTETGMSQGDKITRLRRAIIGQESNGNFQAVNPDSGALGYAQVMPENLPQWSKAALGYSVTPEQFLSSPDLQIKIIDHRLKGYLERELKDSDGDEAIAIRRVASAWYSGQPNLYDNSSPQPYNGRVYPSIRDYTLSILDRYRSQ